MASVIVYGINLLNEVLGFFLVFVICALLSNPTYVCILLFKKNLQSTLT